MLFFGETASAAAATTKALRFSNADQDWISRVTAARAELGDAIDDAIGAGAPVAAEVRRWVARIGRMRTETFFTLNAAWWRAKLATAPNDSIESRLAPLTKLAVEIAFRDPIELSDLAIDGEDLRKAGIRRGPQMGQLLHALLQRVIDDPTLNTNAKLLELAKQGGAS